jgi:hypothetical protein
LQAGTELQVLIVNDGETAGADGANALESQQSKKIPPDVGQQCPSKFNEAHCGFDEHVPEPAVGVDATGADATGDDGDAPQQFRKIPSGVGQQLPSRPRALQAGTELHVLLIDGAIAVGNVATGVDGDNPQQSRKIPSGVGQQSPSRPSALQAETELHSPLAVGGTAVGAKTTGTVATGSDGDDPQQSKKIPSGVGQQSPSRPRDLQAGTELQVPFIDGGSTVGDDATGTVATGGDGDVPQQSKKIPSGVGQQSPTKPRALHLGT